MRVYAILAHDKNSSLNASIFNRIIENIKSKKIDVKVVNLYDYADKIPFFIHDKEKLESIPFFQETKENILTADRLLIVHPIYWYSVPGILKAWIDLITNYAYKYEKGLYAKALHKIKKAMVVNTSMAPLFYRKYLTCNTATKQLKETLKFIGINNISFYEIGNVYKMDKQKFENHIENILKVSDTFLD
jgi:NAD(P)H dehydrogenase (quinone)